MAVPTGSDASVLEHTRTGTGPVLLLIHGIGSRQEAWDPVLPFLRPHREVVTIDMPGFGRSPMRPGQVMSPRGLAATVAQCCAAAGIVRPHVAGNSLGGWVALELARTGLAASVTGLSPAGLWRSCPRYTRFQVRYMHDAPAAMGRLIEPVSRVMPLRVAMSANIFGRPWRVPREKMLAEGAAMVGAVGYEPALAAAERLRFTGGMAIDVPVTVAFGRRDVMLGPGCRLREELPAHTRWLTPGGWGHMPTYDDPEGVAQVLLEGSAS